MTLIRILASVGIVVRVLTDAASLRSLNDNVPLVLRP